MQLATRNLSFHPCAMFKSFSIFDENLFGQCDVAAMDCTLCPTFANVSMYHFEHIWLESFPSNFKPIFHKRFANDTFLLFWSKDHVEKFKNYLKNKNNIK